MQTQTNRKEKRSKLPGELLIALFVSLCLLLTTTASVGYQEENPPETTTESVVTDEPVTEEPVGDQIPATEPVATQKPDEAEILAIETEEETVEILVGLSKNKVPDDLVPEHVKSDGKAWKFSESSELEKLNIIVLNVPASRAQDEIQRIQKMPGVTYAEPNYRFKGTDTIPNDTDFPIQYALNAIRAPQGWDISTGATTVTIAIVDTGVDYGHAVIPGKFVAGYDFVNSDNFANDDNGHGTHVAGIAAAFSNNGLGIAGVSWGARIMPVKVLAADNTGTSDDISAGIIWAADHGAQIINLSLGGPNASNTLENAVNYAAGLGALLIASAGNNLGNLVFYPARYPVVMAVAATDASNQHASFSNYGPEIDVAAPGDSIYGLDIGGYSTRTGTSMAAPHVSGLAAILWAQAGQGSASNVRWSIESTALDIDLPGWDPYSGAGLIQMDAALGATSPPTATFTAIPVPAPANNSNQPFAQGNIFSQPDVTATWTLLSAAAVSFTPTFTPTVTSSIIPTASPTSTENILNSPTPEAKMSGQDNTQNKWWDRLGIFQSPLFCGGMLLILFGLIWIWIILQRQQRTKRITLNLGSTGKYLHK